MNSSSNGLRRWRFELSAPSAETCAKVNYARDNGDILLHVDYRVSESCLVFNTQLGGVWQKERVATVPPRSDSERGILLTVAQDESSGVCVSWDGGRFTPEQTSFQELLQARVWHEGAVVWHQTPEWRSDFPNAWRLAGSESGFPAMNGALARKIEKRDVEPGLSFLIRAKNEAHNVQRCIRSISGLGDEILFVDNGSTDETAILAERLKQTTFELKTFSYPYAVPRIGREHAQAVLTGNSNTLGHYYNWCLARSTRANFIKWDADYVAVRENLRELIRRFDLRTRADNFVVWFSGLELYTDGERYWVDTRSTHSEFRAFSLRHGHHWVNVLPWEEIEQSALFRAQKLFYRKPVYIELFRLDEVEFGDRGIFTDDTRDRERLAYLNEFRRQGRVPDSFVEVEGLEDPALTEFPLSERELALADYFDRHFRHTPRITHRQTQAQVGFDQVSQSDFAVFIISCQRNSNRQEAIRQTWAKDLEALGIPYFFVIGRPGQEAHVVGDCLYLDVPDSYEFLASKVLEACRFSLEKMNVTYLFKIDDDSVLDAYRLLTADLEERPFVGGGVAGGAGSVNDWHHGKCANEQLDLVSCFCEAGVDWVGGQFGYALSVQAREALLAQGQQVRESLYEDYIVAKVLSESGFPFRVPFGDKVSVKDDGNWEGRNDVVLVCDIADVERMRWVYGRLVGADRLLRERKAFPCRVDYDWMDFEAVRGRLLTDERPASMPE